MYTVTMIRNHLRLALALMRQELVNRYAGTNFGRLWLLFSPLVTIFIYTIVFSDFMKMKLGVSDNHYSYSLYLVPGLLSWNFFSAVVSRLSGSIHEKSPILKKINLPMHLYYVGIALTEFVFFLVAMGLGTAFAVVAGVHVTILMLISILLVMGLLFLFSLGMGVLFSLFTPFFHDLREIVPVILQLWFWMTPIVYVKSMIEHKYPLLVTLNPVYYFIEPLQKIFLHSRLPGMGEYLTMVLLACAVLIPGAWLYKKMIPTIKDIL